MQLVSFYYYR